MSEPEITLTFRKERCKEVVIKGETFVHVDTGLTVDEFVRVILKFATSDDKAAVVINHD